MHIVIWPSESLFVKFPARQDFGTCVSKHILLYDQVSHGMMQYRMTPQFKGIYELHQRVVGISIC